MNEKLDIDKIEGIIESLENYTTPCSDIAEKLGEVREFITVQQAEIESLKGPHKVNRCLKCKSRCETTENVCILICCENLDPVRNNTKASHYNPEAI